MLNYIKQVTTANCSDSDVSDELPTNTYAAR